MHTLINYNKSNLKYINIYIKLNFNNLFCFNSLMHFSLIRLFVGFGVQSIRIIYFMNINACNKFDKFK